MPFTAYAGQLNPDAQMQIDHLLKFISQSACQFNRNGDWYEASEAAKHINKKYQYVLKKGLIENAEDFIKYSATKSSMSGKAYKVKCGSDKEITSQNWLITELKTFRKTPK